MRHVQVIIFVPLPPNIHTMKHILTLLISLCLLAACSPEETNYRIGVSQCSDDEWRAQMNKEIRREALFYPGTEVEIRTAKDNNQQQIADIEHFIRKRMDLLIVSPNEAKAIMPVVEKAFDADIPVVLIDRKIHSDKYTAYVGADNYEIGQRAGTYIANRLHGKGRMVEITGLRGSTPAVERHRGMKDALASFPDIEIIATADAGWFQDAAEHALDSILSRYSQIDLVFAQNDRMAIGGHRSAVRHHREKEIAFVGIDAVSGKGFGVESVAAGELDATFIYPTGGDRAMQVAMAILQGKPYERETKLSTALVDRHNARIMQMQTEHISSLDHKIEMLNSQLDAYFLRYSAQRMFLYACIVILILVAVLLVFTVRAFWTKNRMNAELSQQKTQLENQRDQLINLSHQLEEATHAKLAFFTNVSHDFRTPLTLIADPVSQLMTSGNLDERERALLNIVHKNVTVLLRLINQILDFRKFENGKLDMHLSQFDICESMKEWTEAFRTLSYRKHIRFKVNTEKVSDSCMMIADAEKMERITYNLLSNAFKFTPENGEIEVRLSQMRKDGTDWLRLQVSDTGIGMSAEHVQHIFERFYQIDVHHAGSGIGLALVKAFVEMHHGEVHVESKKGEGTSFIVDIPMRQSGNLTEGTEKNAALANLKEGAILDADLETIRQKSDPITPEDKETVLVIDDNQDVRDYVKMLLQDQYTVIEAVNGLEGLKQAMKYVPDAIICDVMMPIMDGMECCRRLKKELQTSHIPVILLTAYAMDEQKIKGYECGADSYLTKPFNARMLTVRLHNLIENRQRLQTFFSDQTTTTQKSLTEIDKGFIEKLRRLIENNLSNSELKVEDLGSQIGLGRVQLYRKTKALTGYPPNELLRIARLKKAALLLASTEKTIAEIGYEVGFSSPSYFTRCYKDYFGESPTDFLKRTKENSL